jgi:hypothetical protein
VLTRIPTGKKVAFNQSLITDPAMVFRRYQNIKKKAEAFDQEKEKAVILYERPSNSRQFCHEAGIIYTYGPACIEINAFPAEMLRLFSWDRHTGFDLAEKYFVDLMEKNAFLPQTKK